MSGYRIPLAGRVEVMAEAPPDACWRLLADVTRTGEWSHECHRVEWLDGADTPVPGARFRGWNRSGRLRWSRTCEVVAAVAPRELAWRTVSTPLLPDSTEWRVLLEPAGSGTRIVQSFEVTKLPRLLEALLARVNPSHRDRSKALSADLRRLADLAARQSAGEDVAATPPPDGR